MATGGCSDLVGHARLAAGALWFIDLDTPQFTRSRLCHRPAPIGEWGHICGAMGRKWIGSDDGSAGNAYMPAARSQ
jgi:hypothetical protein